MTKAHNDILIPQLERAIADLSQNLSEGADVPRSRKLIAFFRSTLAECSNSQVLGAQGTLSLSAECEAMHALRADF